MKTYSNGEQVQLGDHIQDGNKNGIVVVLINERIALAPYSVDEWIYLETGFIVNLERTGLIHYSEAGEDLRLIHRIKPV